MSKKLWTVSADVTIDLVVLAEDAEEAGRVARSNWYDEFRDNGEEPRMGFPYEVKRRRDIGFMTDADIECVNPYGEPSPQETISELLEGMGIK